MNKPPITDKQYLEMADRVAYLEKKAKIWAAAFIKLEKSNEESKALIEDLWKENNKLEKEIHDLKNEIQIHKQLGHWIEK